MKIKVSIYIILIIISCNDISHATDYYVSKTGSDSNNGTSTSTSWLHHPWDTNATGTAASATLAAGDRVIMRRGDTWYGVYITSKTAGTSGNAIATTSLSTFYKTSSSDALPVVSGGYDTTSWTWSNTSGGIYQLTSPSTISTLPNSIWYGTTRLTSSGTTTTPASGCWGYSGSGPYTLYVNVNGSSAPPVDGTLHVPQQNYVAVVSNAYVTFNYLTCQDANTALGGVVYCNKVAGFELNSCIVQYSNYHMIYVDLNAAGATCTVFACTVGTGYYASATNISCIQVKGGGSTTVFSSIGNTLSSGLPIGIGTTSAGPSLAYIYSCIINGMNTLSTTAIGINISVGTGWIIHDNTVYNIGSSNASNVEGIKIGTGGNSVYSNIVHDVRLYGIYITSCNTNNVYKNTVSLCGYMSSGAYPYTYPDNMALYNSGSGGGIEVDGSSAANNVYQNRVSNSYQGIGLNCTSGAGGNLVYYNIAYINAVNGIGDYTDANPTNRNLFYFNTVYHSPAAGNSPAYTGHAFHCQDVSGGGGKAAFAGNLAYNAVTSGNSHCFFVTNNGGLNSVYTSYNDWYAVSGGVNVRVLGTSYTDLSTYKAAVQGSSYFAGIDGIQADAEKCTIFSDPLFVSISGYDFHLMPGSPCINAGVDVGLVSDYEGKAIKGLPDIGVFEFYGHGDRIIGSGFKKIIGH